MTDLSDWSKTKTLNAGGLAGKADAYKTVKIFLVKNKCPNTKSSLESQSTVK